MCATCGCGETEEKVHHDHEHVLADGTVVRHSHDDAADHGDHDHDDHHHDDHHHEGESRRIKVEQDILAKNDSFAAVNRRRFEQAGTFAVNLMSSPGSGKTTLLVRTLQALEGVPLAVIEGDQQTNLDASRIEATGVKAIQINTGKGCHLDASMVGKALEQLQPLPHGLLFIENVGNLVCPAGFDLGEKRKVVVVSVTEGEDKPLKYAQMFAVADLVVINKIDLVPHLDFDLRQLEVNVNRVKPGLPILRLSARTGEGFEPWLQWLRQSLSQEKRSHA